ncbi:putative inactive receptor kinase [Platanthera zijinensis]|uniref:Inactive receptor kinase n=1 Tax=Platanthera zijinensis TaxID=2320716 RepID=A0AAP0FZY7_9ASPA
MSVRGAARSDAAFFFLFLALTSVSPAAEDDVRCLRDLKQSLGDPYGLLDWDFSNNAVGSICSFSGIFCWHPQENRILSVELSSRSLAGSIPPALQFCRSATTLDLSGNVLTGSIPPTLCDWLPFLVSLDLSRNRLSGPIPPELSNCIFLNKLILSSNSLSGQIPASLSRLERLKELDLSNNRLTGEIPFFPFLSFGSNRLTVVIPGSIAASFPSSSFESNVGLCGQPLSSRCGSHSHHTGLIVVIAAGVFGASASLALAYFVWRCYFSSDRKETRKPISGEAGSLWADRLTASQHRLVPVSLFQKPIVKVKLSDLLSATRNFHREHIVIAGSERVGTAFKAVLSDGSALTITRLHGCTLGEMQFRSEMRLISQLRHPNLVPFLGFCLVEGERLLVYKYMPDGALSSFLRSPANNLKWLARLCIAVGTARGLAWLHHGFQSPFLHQAITSNAILLDEDLDARIIDFGLPRLISSSAADIVADASPFANGIFGEPGYFPPEYAHSPMATTKGDVFAFGVVLLELVTGQKPTEVFVEFTGEASKGNLVEWINQLAAAGRLLDSVDPNLRGEEAGEEILQVLRVAVSCVSYRPKDRPSMYHAYQSLKILWDNNHNSSEHIVDSNSLWR